MSLGPEASAERLLIRLPAAGRLGMTAQEVRVLEVELRAELASRRGRRECGPIRGWL